MHINNIKTIVPFFIDFSVLDREKTRFVSFFAVFLYLFGKNICLASENINKNLVEVNKDEKHEKNTFFFNKSKTRLKKH